MKKLSRRTFLHGMGVSMALPFLEAMHSGRALGAPTAVPKRFVAINIPLSFIPENFFPSQAGADYALSPYLKIGEALKNDFSVISGTSHPGVDGGHSAEKSFLTGAPSPGSRSFKNTISFDQYLAERVGESTRFASLTLGENTLSWSANGVAIPPETSPRRLYSKLFLSGSAKEVAAAENGLKDGRSIMDAVLAEAREMERSVSAADREKLDQYFTAVRATEQRLEKMQKWNQTPKPRVQQTPPGEIPAADLVGTLRAYFEVIRLALETDTTRVLALGGTGYGVVPKIQGVQLGYHGLSHHGKNPEMLAQLELIERATLGAFFEFLANLKSVSEGPGTLLSNTQIFLGSNLGNASGHITTNLPVVLAGGGYKHGRHLAFDPKNNYPLSNMFVSIAHQMGLETNAFAKSTGPMAGLV